MADRKVGIRKVSEEPPRQPSGLDGRVIQRGARSFTSPVSDAELCHFERMPDAPYTNEELAKLGDDAFPQRGTYCPRCRNFIPSFAAIRAAEEARLRSPVL